MISDPSPQPFIHKLFIGPEGLHAPWRVLIYVGMQVSLFAVLVGLVDHGEDIIRLRVQLYDKVAFTLSAILPALLMARLENRSFAIYGLPILLRKSWKKFLIGSLWGIAAITFLLLILRGLNAFYFGPLALHGKRAIEFAIFWGVFFLLVALSEEFLVRGYTQFTLTQAIGFWPSAILLSIAFGLLHLRNRGEASIGIVAASVIGFFLCLTLRRTGNLWFAVGFHTLWDWGESYLYSVPDSGTVVTNHLLRSSFHGPAWLTGGTVGPEGSVLLFVVVALLWILFDRTHRETKYSPPAATK
jgi:membrane protease YdiL (CAAX protease family)